MLTGRPISIDDFADVVFRLRPVRLSPQARQRMRRSRNTVEAVVERGEVVYGVSTGFGGLANQVIPHDDLRQLQVNLVRSHACGTGPPLSTEETRGIILLRAHVLSQGYSGVRAVLVETLLELLNRSVIPLLPSRGSVGASGDLIPLAHLARVLIGEGEARWEASLYPAAEALRLAGISPIRLEAKEGLSLVNGTQASLAVGLLALLRAEMLLATADLAGAMSLEGLKGTSIPFDPRIQLLRPHAGQRDVARRITRLLAGSEVRTSHIGCSRVQDPYSLRCIPQVHGAVNDAAAYVRKTFETEINSVTDNPLVFPEEGEILAGGNFHGHPIALALDLLGIGMTQIGLISERRIAQLVHPEFIDLPSFLTPHPGLHSGFMMPHVAAAALASECKILSHPASADTIPTSGNQEDYVSMSMGSALKLSAILDNVQTILAIELLASAQGVEFHQPLRPGRGVERGLAHLRSRIPRVEADRSLQPEIEEARRMISRGEFAKIATG
ncbi:MAG TPA: histidine ammonia-lyase [Nitrospiria bacterium]|nr:histidine ammonia-lyase [Nitrospiria bacterium]